MITATGSDLRSVVIDTGSAHPARFYDYLLGGADHFAVDQEAAERGSAALPGGIEQARKMVHAQREFLVGAVQHLAGELGVRQFLDIGTGIPNGDNVHALARQSASDARVVYVDKDPVVLAHAHQLVRSTPEGAADYIHADLRDPETILRDAAATLDFAHPMGLILVGVLHSIPDEDNPCAIVTGLLDAVCVGSYMALTHLARDVHPEMAEAMRRANETMTDPFVLRSRTEVARFLGGLETLEPGIVTVDRWQPDDTKIRPAEDPEVAVYCAIGRKQ